MSTSNKKISGLDLYTGQDYSKIYVPVVFADVVNTTKKILLSTALATRQAPIADLETIRSGAAAGATALQPGALSPYRTASQQDVIDNSKQPTISDLQQIRSGASAGATAVQPADISDMATKTWVNGRNFITATVSNLANYYLKSETYTKSEVDALIAAIGALSIEVVAVLPTASASTMGKIYLVPTTHSAEKNVKDEYITIDNGTSAQTRYTWELIGSTAIDLSDYYTKTQTDSAISTAVSDKMSKKTSATAGHFALFDNAGEVADTGLRTESVTSSTPASPLNVETTDHKVSQLTAASTNTQYPGAKAVYDAIQAMQPKIHDGDPIGLINGVEFTWGGNIVIQGGGGGSITIDAELSNTSQNAVQNRVITQAIASFITKSVSDLVNYYTKTETYTQAEVNSLISAISQFRYELASTLPTASASTMNKIYLVPKSDAEQLNAKDEYITIDNGTSADVRYTWEKIGDTAVSLANYYTKSETDSAINNHHDSSKQPLIDSANKLSYSLLSDTPSIPTKTSDLTNDSNFLTGGQGVITSIANIPVTARALLCNIAASGTLSFASLPALGNEIHLVIHNTGSASITIDLPNSGDYVCTAESQITIEAGKYGEVNLVNINSKGYIRAIGS